MKQQKFNISEINLIAIVRRNIKCVCTHFDTLVHTLMTHQLTDDFSSTKTHCKQL